MARAGGGMAPQFWVLRCCSCRLFQVQQAKRSGKWSCSVCGQRQAVQKIYGQGSGLDCRHHVQKLNLLQGEAEEAVRWTSRCIEESVNDSKNIAAEHEGSSVQQEGRAQVSRWSKYLDKNSEDQEDGEEEADRERQQFCSRKNTVEEQRKHQKSFLSSDVAEYVEENGVFHLAYQAKKVKTAERKKCLVAVPDPDHGDAVSGDRMVPVVCKSVVPEENTQTPAACNKPSKWEKFLTCSDNCSGNAARVTLSPQEGSGRLGLCSTSAAAAGMPSKCSEQAGRTPCQGTGFEFAECIVGTGRLASELPGTMVPSASCSIKEDVLLKAPQSYLIGAGSGGVTTAGGCCLDSMSKAKANTLTNCNAGPRPSNISSERLFCTGEEFDDDL